jgi:hypothetical protein
MRRPQSLADASLTGLKYILNSHFLNPGLAPWAILSRPHPGAEDGFSDRLLIRRIDVLIDVEQHRLSSFGAFRQWLIPAGGRFDLVTVRIGIVKRSRQAMRPKGGISSENSFSPLRILSSPPLTWPTTTASIPCRDATM